MLGISFENKLLRNETHDDTVAHEVALRFRQQNSSNRLNIAWHGVILEAGTSGHYALEG